jgi:hypothetical protein
VTAGAAPTAADWLARAAAIEPRTELFIDGRFVPAASGRTFDDVTVPFGGFKQSGFGRDKGLQALDGYTQLKTTWIDLSGG